MCGIVGVVSNKLKNKFVNRFIHKGLGYLKHRGPDDNGSIVYDVRDSVIGLGHTRLSIIDLSERAHQPMVKNAVAVVFNGEIYNYKKLRDELSKRIEFNSCSDTEVILNGYLLEGKKFLQKLNGIFALAIYDNDKIIIIRDRTGVKPLYYYSDDNTFAFSSDIDPLLELTVPEINQESLALFLRVGYTKPDQSIFDRVMKVLPGQCIEINVDKIKLFKENLYKLPVYQSKVLYDVAKVKDDVISAVKKQMVSDVPVGVFLSGGLDSTIITYIASQNNNNLIAFTTKFITNDSYQKFNTDYEVAKVVAEDLKIKLEVIEINDNDDKLTGKFKQYINGLNEPQANFTGFSTYLVTQRARELGIKVLLSGDGADEVFGGYSRYKKFMLFDMFKPFSYIHPKGIKYLLRDLTDIYIDVTSVLTNKQLKNILTYKNYRDASLDAGFDFKSYANAINYFDIRFWISEESNQRVDRASMMNSVEVRVPFQDPELINKYFPLKLSCKIRNNNVKRVLKDAFKGCIPTEVIDREKSGWIAPDSKWFRGFLSGFIYKTLSRENLEKHNFFKVDEVDKIIHKHMNGEYYRNELKILLSFQVWYNKYFNSIK